MTSDSSDTLNNSFYIRKARKVTNVKEKER
jgi:hypothetical protein